MDQYDEWKLFHERRTDKVIVGKRFMNGEYPMRIISKVVDGQEGYRFANIKTELVVRETDRSRFEIKAKFFEDDRSVSHLTIQRFGPKNPSEHWYFTFRGSEIDAVLKFMAGVQTVPLPTPGKRHISDSEMQEILFDRAQLRRALIDKPDLLAEIMGVNFQKDFKAVGYRRAQLERFAKLLNDKEFFASECQRLSKKPEALWQAFFEANKWIFGYGLAYQFLGALDDRKLEQIVSGHSLSMIGKRADAVMKSQGIANSLCFVEIKRHDTDLLEEAPPYRTGAWAPSTELAGGVAQLQATVEAAAQSIGRALRPEDELGNPSGELLMNIEPRAFLVIGSLREFGEAENFNQQQFRSFELFRRNTRRPEILTFDELYERARFIVEQPD